MSAVAAPCRSSTTCSYCGEPARYDYIVGKGGDDEKVLASACDAKPCKARLGNWARWRWAN